MKDGEAVDKITKYTGLTHDEIENMSISIPINTTS
jgi:hypothetical protein